MTKPTVTKKPVDSASAATVDEMPMPTPAFRLMAIADLRECPDNPRRHFNLLALNELRDSIAVHGVLTPLRVRSVTGTRGGMIAAGHRRFRAAKLAGLTEVPCLVGEMSDAAFVELLTVDNLQRDDLHPLEEARGYELLMKQLGYDVKTIAAKVGKSHAYVYDRMRLLQLTKPAQELFLEGRFELGHAIILARLTPADQDAAIGTERKKFSDGGLFERDEAASGDWRDEPDPEFALLDTRKARSVRELQQWVDDRIRFNPRAKDVPELFPATAAKVAEATASQVRTIAITYDHQLKESARAEERTYGPASWKRADGEAGSKTCQRSVLGIVVAGPNRGTAMQVCIDKKRCDVHYAAEIRAAAKREKEKAKGVVADPAVVKEKKEEAAAREKAAERAREVEGARWVRAIPELRTALAAVIRKAPTGQTGRCGQLVLQNCTRWNTKNVPETFGAGAEGVLREAAFRLELQSLDQWSVQQNGSKVLKAWGIDAQKIVDRVCPPEPKPAARKSDGKSAPKKKLAGDVRRAAGKKKAAKR